MQCSTDKNAIRSFMKQKRSSLSREDIDCASQKICHAFVTMEQFLNAGTVCVYMSAFGEVDTSYIIKKCTDLGKTVVVPVVEGEDIRLCHLQGELKKGAFGILEPEQKSFVSAEAVDIFAVPGVAFDKSGNRVGFGKGYYDKLLGGVSATKVGLMYDFQLVSKIPCQNHDITMDYLIDESKVFRCGYDV